MYSDLANIKAMGDRTKQPSSDAARPRQQVLIVGEAALPEDLRRCSRSGFLSLVIVVDAESNTVLSVECKEIAPAAERILAEYLVGQDLQIAHKEAIGAIQSGYFATTKAALVAAL